MEPTKERQAEIVKGILSKWDHYLLNDAQPTEDYLQRQDVTDDEASWIYDHIEIQCHVRVV